MNKHKTIRDTSIITQLEWAAAFGVTRQTLAKWIKDFEKAKAQTYNARDIFSVLEFYRFAWEKKYHEVTPEDLWQKYLGRLKLAKQS